MCRWLFMMLGVNVSLYMFTDVFDVRNAPLCERA